MPILDPNAVNVILPTASLPSTGEIWEIPKVLRLGRFIRPSIAAWNLIIYATVGPTTINVNLMASLDGVNFFLFDSTQSGAFHGSAYASPTVFAPCKYLQAVCTALSGGTNVSYQVTAILGFA